MGYISHQVVIVICGYKDFAEESHSKAMELYPYTSELMLIKTNGYYSFYLGPDGSKEGWEESNEKEMLRIKFVEWLEEQKFTLKRCGLEWAVINFPEDREPYINLHHFIK